MQEKIIKQTSGFFYFSLTALGITLLLIFVNILSLDKQMKLANIEKVASFNSHKNLKCKIDSFFGNATQREIISLDTGWKYENDLFYRGARHFDKKDCALPGYSK